MRWIFSFILFGLLGCNISPSGDDTLKTMLVQTTYNENVAFDFYTTFTLSPDTLGLLSNIDQDTFFVSDYTKNATAKIKSEMVKAGYTFVGKNQNPDLGIAATVVENYKIFQQTYYPAYYSGYYGYGYGGYYGTPYVSVYRTSTLFLVINLIDLKNRDAQGRLQVLWTAYIGDLQRSVDPYGNVIKAIEQAFKQSSAYLKKP